MKNLALLITFFLCISPVMEAQQMFMKYKGNNIGNPILKGNYSFNAESQQFSLQGAGYNIWFERDEFYFVSCKVSGDFILSTNLGFLGDGVNLHRKIGVMIRNSKEDNAIYMDGVIHGDGLTSLQYRKDTGGATVEKSSKITSPEFIQVERKGNEFILRISKNGSPLEVVGRVNLEMNNFVFAGLFICSHNKNAIEKANFWNVRLEKPFVEGIEEHQKPSSSRLEILDLDSGMRKVIYETQTHIEAPNWTRDGKYLIYNSDGKLYNFDLKTGESQEINTGFATNNNNDHGISFDGKTLAISHHAEDAFHQSIIYTIPVIGGAPQRVTMKGPSYWHGWSPDGKWLTYCAERNGNFDVYKIPSEGGEEVRLTNAKSLDDGPEYSPDGRYIYFNSVRSGGMQIWRMKPDGSNKEQMTFDNFQNWFAHPSPDGKQLIFISYLPEVTAGSHPSNQRVMLRIMSVDGGEIKTVAFLYGGQGTINVPSWSPDSKKIAFVSYTY